MRKPDPELLPIQPPRCPKCQMRMKTTSISDEPEGFEQRTFECQQCGHSETKMLAFDPLQTGAVRWLSSELQPPK